MDIKTIDQQYNRLQSASQQIYRGLKDLATKLQTESGNGNQQAREWVLGLKGIAPAIQAQRRIGRILQSGFGRAMEMRLGFVWDDLIKKNVLGR